MELSIILAGLAIVLFISYFIYARATRSAYLLAIVVLMPFLDLGVTPFNLGGLCVFDIITIIAFFTLFRDFFNYKRVNIIYFLLSVVFLLLIILSSMNSEFPVKSLFGLITVLTPFIYCRILLKEMSLNPGFLINLLKVLKIACFTGIAFVLIQLVIGPSFTFYSILNQNVANEGQTRYPGFFMDSQMSGLFFSMMSFVFLINLDNLKKPSVKQYIFFAIVVLAVLLAGARSGLLSFCVALAFITLFIGGRFRTYAVIFSIISGGILLLFSDYFVIMGRFGSFDESLTFRASIWDGAWDIFKSHFNLGIGFNNYKDFAIAHAQDQYLLIDNDEILFMDAPENGYLKLLVELGFFATLFLFIMILSPVINVLYNFFNGKKVNLAFFFMGSVICLLVTSFSFHSFADSRIILLLCTSLVLMISLPVDPKVTYEF